MYEWSRALYALNIKGPGAHSTEMTLFLTKPDYNRVS